ncbi:MAG: hypothetical protein NC254_13085 [bacterium]|nr:hypothetical protein [bacterium]
MNTSEYIHKNFHYQDLKEEQQTFFNTVGQDKYINLCHELGGFQVYFLKKSALCSIVRKKNKDAKKIGHERSFNLMNNDAEYLLDDLTIDDIPEKQKLLFEILGQEKYIQVCCMFGGSQINIPKEETLRVNIVKRKIRESKELVRSGVLTIGQLAMMYKVSTSTVYGIVREKK